MKKDIDKKNSLNDFPSLAWEKFLKKSKEITPVEKWELAHILGYWYAIYEKQFGCSYTINFSRPPSKSFDIMRIKSIANNISANPVILKDYIEWVFNEKVIKNKIKIRTLAVLVKDEYIDEYKAKFLTIGDKPIDRSTAIPPNFVNVIKAHNQTFTTYGDLAFAAQCGDQYSYLLDDLAKAGMDLKALDRVK